MLVVVTVDTYKLRGGKQKARMRASERIGQFRHAATLLRLSSMSISKLSVSANSQDIVVDLSCCNLVFSCCTVVLSPSSRTPEPQQPRTNLLPFLFLSCPPCVTSRVDMMLDVE